MSRFFRYKCIRNQVSNDNPDKPGRARIPNATYNVQRPFAFWFQRRKYLKGFTLYGHGGHLGHETINIRYKFTPPPPPPPNLRIPHMKFEFNWPSGF